MTVQIQNNVSRSQPLVCAFQIGGKYKSQASQADFPGNLNFLCLTCLADKFHISRKICKACLRFEFPAN